MLSLRSTRFSQLNAILEDQHYVYGCRLRLSRDPTRTVQTEDARCPLMRTLRWSQEFGSPQRRHQHHARVASSLASTTSTHFSSAGNRCPTMTASSLSRLSSSNAAFTLLVAITSYPASFRANAPVVRNHFRRRKRIGSFARAY